MTTATKPTGPALADLLERGQAELAARRRQDEDRERQAEQLRREAWASLTWNAGEILGELAYFTTSLPNDPPFGFKLGMTRWEVCIFPPAGSHAYIRVLFEQDGAQWKIWERREGPCIDLMTPTGPESKNQFDFERQPSLAAAVSAHEKWERDCLQRRVEAARWAREQR